MPLEEMGSFFNARVEMYDEHMLKETDGGAESYVETAKLIPAAPGLKLLDLGCGTGLELDEIFKINPSIQVTGIDLAEKMLEKLARKHAARKSQIKLILADYFTYKMETNQFDIALSVESLHHFTPEVKIGLYKKIHASLRPAGFYIENDYMAPTQEEQDRRFGENKRIRSESGITQGHYHYDTPCTVENQIYLLKQAGFSSVEKVWQQKNAAILVAKK
jgi:tRNA (cmo5U34)-methyltransferase